MVCQTYSVSAKIRYIKHVNEGQLLSVKMLQNESFFQALAHLQSGWLTNGVRSKRRPRNLCTVEFDRLTLV